MADASGEKNDASYDRLLWLIDYGWTTPQGRRLKRDELATEFLRTGDASQSGRAAFDRYAQDFSEGTLTHDLRSALLLAYARRTVRVDENQRRGRRRRERAVQEK